jgi:DNA-binding NtrC family response regulator
MARVLIVDDELPLRRLLKGVLTDDGHEVAEAAGAAAARDVLLSGIFDVVVTDQRMPDGSGSEVMAFCHEQDASLPVIMMTAYASVDLAVEVMRGGAFDFISKPFQPAVVRSCIRRAAEQTRLLRDNRRLRGEIRQLRTNDLVGESAAMLAVKEQIRKVAPTKATVVIQGETGTGKELVARAIHDGCPRAAAPFIAVNCAAMAETLLESELFGHEKGAFTGADRARAGVFEAADGGTLFLDEAGDMPPSLQAKLLRVLMDGRFCRVGATKERRADVRVIAASHRNLLRAAEEGTFREDLYYRLAVFTISLPPLRERPEDLAPIATALLGKIRKDLGTTPQQLSKEALGALKRYAFPGNVRELRNILERAAILADGEEIGPEHLTLGGSVRGGGEPANSLDGLAGALLRGGLGEGGLKAALEEVERSVVARSLADANGVQAEAARRLGMSKSDFFYRVQKYGLGAEGEG